MIAQASLTYLEDTKCCGKVNAESREIAGAFRTLRLARDFVEIGSWFWLMGGGFWKMARLGNGMPYENTS